MAERDSKSVFPYLLLGVFAIVVFAAIIGGGMGWLQRADVFSPEIALTTLLVVGVGGLLIVLSCMVAVFSRLNLSAPGQSLGLPEGSVRAVIALSLLLIFAIQAVYLYGDLSAEAAIFTSTGITEPQLDKSLAKGQIVSIVARQEDGQKVFDVQMKSGQSEASVDFAKQLLTTLSTLLVAVAGFYFGTKSVAAARSAVEVVSPLIRSMNPTQGTAGQEVSIEISGRNFKLPKVVKLVQGNREMVCESILSSSTEIRGKLKIDQDAKGKWKLLVINDDDGEDSLIDALEVKPKPTEPKPTEPTEPTEPKPTEPTEPTEPKPTEPKPTKPKPTEPKPTESR